MFKQFTRWLSSKPMIFNFMRRLIEFNFISIKNAIKKEFYLNNSAQDQKSLDVPCGTGEFSMLFHPDGYIGIDISKKYIDYAKKTYPRTFYCRDACATGFEDFYFDNILILGLFHHLDLRSIKVTLEEIKRVLKKDGKVLFIEDSPIPSGFNLIGRILQKFDVGSNIRPAKEYFDILHNLFHIEKYYPLRNAFWQYSVFVLRPINYE